MNHLENVVRRIGGVGAVIAGIFLVGIMVLITANVIMRLFGGLLPGNYEMVSLFMVVAVAFALGYTALHKFHVVIDSVISHFSPRVKSISQIITSLISFIILGLMVWANIGLTQERWLAEISDTLKIPYLPFRLALILGLILWCLVVLIDLLKGLRQVVSK